MKILIIGFLALLGWSALSTHLYVCDIRGLCSEREVVQIAAIKVNNADTADMLSDSLAGKPDRAGENLTIFFAFDKSDFELKAGDAAGFEKSVAYLHQNLKSGLSITGFTDAIGSDKYNLALGYRRAISVKKYFETKGVAAEKMVILSKGEYEPEGDNKTIKGRAQNRRTTISIKN